jgi:hypothetical protein
MCQLSAGHNNWVAPRLSIRLKRNVEEGRVCVYGINGSGVVEGERLGCSKTKVCVEWAGE